MGGVATVRRAAALLLTVAAAGQCVSTVQAKTVVIHNDVARRDVEGNYVDAHDGKIVHVNGTYFLYVLRRTLLLANAQFRVAILCL
jgi:hypothetical protein